MGPRMRRCLLAAWAIGGLCGVVRAEVMLQGMGATFPAPLYALWVEKYNQTHPGIKVDYQAVGSAIGVKAITEKTVSFGASDSPLTETQLKAMAGGAEGRGPAAVLQIPTVGGAQVLHFNLPGVKRLRLNGEVVAGIFLGNITQWDDARIVALNPAETLPAIRIAVVQPGDGRGSTFTFTDYLCKVSAEWKQRVGRGTTVDWPTGISAKSTGVSALVKATPGAIGCVEFAFVKNANLPFAVLLNNRGKEAPPTLEAIAAAGAIVKPGESAMADLASITDADAEGAYPICGYSYFVVYADLSNMKDREARRALVDFLLWCESDGQKLVEGLGYAPLPPAVREEVGRRLRELRDRE